MEPVFAFLPCRKGSERVPQKNIRSFGPYSHGLVELKLRQLLNCSAISEVILSTNDNEIIDFASRLAEPKLRIYHRNEQLSSSSTSTDLLVSHASDLITSGHILWTHVTSPFVSSKLYGEVISEYLRSLAAGFDSLMTTTLVHSFLWNEEGPLNYSRSSEKWPRTQTLKPIHEVNSAIFLAPVGVYTSHNDRIGLRPRLYPLNRIASLDIDWEEDFLIAEQLLLQGLVSI